VIASDVLDVRKLLASDSDGEEAATADHSTNHRRASCIRPRRSEGCL